MPTIVMTDSGNWKAVIRRTGFPTATKTFCLKCDAEDFARRRLPLRSIPLLAPGG